MDGSIGIITAICPHVGYQPAADAAKEAQRTGRPVRGMSHRSFKRRSTSKQRGAAMSSRLMPPKLLEMSAMVSTSLSVSLRTDTAKEETP